jgi:hypothetical protein
LSSPPGIPDDTEVLLSAFSLQYKRCTKHAMFLFIAYMKVFLFSWLHDLATGDWILASF